VTPGGGRSDSGTRAYRDAGVDLEAAARAVRLIHQVADPARTPEVVAGVGGFAGLYRLGDAQFLAAATDGVGTKLEVARLAGKLDTVGIDLVAMSANDVVCTGARPLFFLDYLAVGRLVPEEVAAIVTGVAEGCRRAGCALLGGETAEHPGSMTDGQFDLAGFCVGLVAEGSLLGPHRVGPGDVLLGLPSSGLHSNGFSLVRPALVGDGSKLHDPVPELGGRTLADELLEPTVIYAASLAALCERELVSAAAHITGGGFHENVPRALPEGLGAVVDASAWTVPPVFGLVADAAGVPLESLFSVLNMGIGMVLVVPADRAEAAAEAAGEAGQRAIPIGEVREGAGVEVIRMPSQREPSY
jgi:phosphoribosylformylglycinamidine cyclo-ligase